jgi:hypothetical protein
MKYDIWRGLRAKEVRTKYGVSVALFNHVHDGSSWAHIPWPKGSATLRHGNSKLTYAQVVEIKAALRAGVPQIQLVRKYNSSRNAISAIKTGKTWKHVVI